MNKEIANHGEVAVFAGGCFWCTEAVFQTLRGIVSVIPGYTGGKKDNPTYEEVSNGKTGHAEAVEIIYDPQLTTYKDLLTVFFATHDPTTRDRQGNDVGTQYRSAIFYTTPEQKREAESLIKSINNSSPNGQLIVTEVLPLDRFFPAEERHKDYYRTHSDNPYCELIINPKLKKVAEQFARLLKK